MLFRSTEAEPEETADATGQDESAIGPTEKELKRQRKAQRAERRAAKEARRQEKQERKRKRREDELKDEAAASATSGATSPMETSENETGNETSSSTALQKTAAVPRGRFAVRSRYSQQKRMAVSDQQALKEIFMIKAGA